MQFEPDLRAAGQRAAMTPVPPPPPLAAMQQKADKQKSNRRLIGSGLAIVAVAALSFPIALNLRGSTTVQNVVAGTGEIAPAAQVDAPEAESDPVSQAATVQDDESSQSTDDEMTFELRTGNGEFSIAIRVVEGEDADAQATSAAAAADETLEVDGITVWVSRSGDQTTVSSLVEADEFVEVTGTAEQLDKLIDVLKDGGPWTNGFGGIDGTDWEQFFGEDFQPFGQEWSGEFDGHSFSFDFGDGQSPDFEQFFDNGQFRDLEEFMHGADGDFPNFEKFFEGRFEDGEFNLDDFLDNRQGFPFGSFGQNFDGCIAIEGDDNGETFSFEFPTGCSTNN